MLDKGGEGQENISQRKKSLERVFLDIGSDWQKIILINFSPITNFFRLPSFSLCRQQHVRSRRLSCRSHPILDERKKRSTHSKACHATPPPPLLSMCPCVMSPFLSLSVMPISLPDWRLHLKTRHGHPLWCPSHCNVSESDSCSPLG